MKKKFRKMLLLIAGLLVTVNAVAYDFEVNGIYYNITSSSERTVGVVSGYYSVYQGNVIIPSKVLYNSLAYKVTSIGEDAFRDCSGLTSVTIPNSVTSIGNYAFYGCSGLTSVTIPNSVTSIGEDTFSGCSGLTSVTIPNSVTSIGNYAFYGCSGLTSIAVESENSKYDSREDCNAIIETAKNTLISGCKTTVIPNSVTSIGDWAFRGCTGLTSVIIPNSVTSIGEAAFRDCSGLTSVTIPNSVTSIGKSAFSGCSGLTSVTIPNSVTSIGNYAFYGCSGLTSVTIPNSVTSIGEDAFSGCSGLTSITIPNSVTSIEYDTFSGCSGLTSVTIPNSVTSIGEYAFSGCSGLTSVTIGNSVTSIGYHAFGGCYGLTSIYCKATTPPTASNPTFEDVVLVNGTLYIPNGSLNSYEAVDPWRNFFNIKETDQFPDGGVEGIEADEIKVVAKGGAIEVSGAEGEQVMVYNLSGQCVYSGMETSVSLEKGIYVVRVAGTVHKIIM